MSPVPFGELDLASDGGAPVPRTSGSSRRWLRHLLSGDETAGMVLRLIVAVVVPFGWLILLPSPQRLVSAMRGPMNTGHLRGGRGRPTTEPPPRQPDDLDRFTARLALAASAHLAVRPGIWPFVIGL